MVARLEVEVARVAVVAAVVAAAVEVEVGVRASLAVEVE